MVLASPGSWSSQRGAQNPSSRGADPTMSDVASRGDGFMIRVLNLAKRYPGGTTALENVNLEIGRGEFVFVTGPSGAGKTTLLRLFLRQELPTEGQILVNGRNVGALPSSKVPDLRRTIGV